jgi:hypothetical protein
MQQGDGRFIANMVPPDVIAKISQAELEARVAYAQQLTGQAAQAADRVIAKGYSDVAKAVLNARPQDEVRRQHDLLMAKSEAMPPGEPREQVRRQARQLMDENPAPPEEQARNTSPGGAGGATHLGGKPGTPPGRQVMKAGADQDLMAVYDSQGRLIGVVPQKAFQPVVQAAAEAVMKADPTGKARSRLGNLPPGRR